jgi:hypothetical protein
MARTQFDAAHPNETAWRLDHWLLRKLERVTGRADDICSSTGFSSADDHLCFLRALYRAFFD